MDAFNLINMNGRCYDPLMARMLSPDPFVQAGAYTQAYNRYSYALNNPLAFTDPSGYLNVGNGSFNLSNYAVDHSSSGMITPNWSSFSAFYQTIGMGTVTGSGALVHNYTPAVMQLMTAFGKAHGLSKYSVTTCSQVPSDEMLYKSAYVSDASGIYTIASLADNYGKSFYILNTVTGEVDIRGANVFPEKFSDMLTGRVEGGTMASGQGGSPYSLYFDGNRLMVVNENTGSVPYSTLATSGSGANMNNPKSQNVPDGGIIPQGNYSFKNTGWDHLNLFQQAKRFATFSGDWGEYNVRLTPLTYTGSRNNFFIHGGYFEGSHGCIDAGLNVDKIYNYVKSQDVTILRVRY